MVDRAASPTSRGAVWLKAPGPGMAFEVELYPVLAAGGRAGVLSPLAVDPHRRWLLLPDGGRVTGDCLEGGPLIDALCSAVRAYAQLQLDLSHSVDELLEAGVPDMRPHVMPARLGQAIEVVRAYVDASPDDADRVVLERLNDSEDQFRQWCAELAGSPVAGSLQHGDLHPHNVFATSIATAPVFFDWGDSTVAHPFTTMLVTLRVVTSVTSGPDSGSEVARVRDAYLEPFTSLAPRAELIAQLELACHVGKVARCLTWAGALSGLPPEEVADDADAPFGGCRCCSTRATWVT